MSNATDEQEKRFWNRYIALLEEYQVMPTLTAGMSSIANSSSGAIRKFA